MKGLVLSNNDISKPFKISHDMKQGCILAPVPFDLFFTCVLNHAVCEFEKGVYLKYRLDGSLFVLCCLNTRSKTLEKLILKALFADDCALMADTESGLQVIVNKFAEAFQLFSLTISLIKMEVLHQPTPVITAPSPTVCIDGTQLKAVDQFKYLGSIISSDVTLDKEIVACISKASQSLDCLCIHVMNHKNIKLATKTKVYKVVVLTSLLYGCETWTLYRKHLKQLE